MKLKDVMLKVNSLAPWSVSLGYYGKTDRIRFLATSLDELYSEWMDNERWPDTYPENGDYVYSLILSLSNGETYIVDCDGVLEPLTFEDLMQALAAKFQK